MGEDVGGEGEGSTKPNTWTESEGVIRRRTGTARAGQPKAGLHGTMHDENLGTTAGAWSSSEPDQLHGLFQSYFSINRG